MENPEKSQLAEMIEVTLVPGLGLQTQCRLWQLKLPWCEILALSPARLASLRVPEDSGRALTSRRYRAAAEEILTWTVKEGVEVLARGVPPYPALLQEIHDPPLLLYARGDLSVLQHPILSLVGTRRPTPYGLQMAEGLAMDLAQRGICIGSGLARGIDAAAHRGCIKAKGATVAVLGNGIDVIYPREHERLTNQILEHGSLLSEFPPGTSPSPQNFPIRNRIISGIALGTLIVEASEYSGSLITARLSMEQNRDVFALPGNVTAPQSFGPNFLIKQGAKLVQTWRDVVEELPGETRSAIFSREEERATIPSLGVLTEDEIRLLNLLSTDRATQFDQLVGRSGKDISDLSDLLLHLEMRGWIRQLPGNLYVRVSRPV